jgi:hypothetical protein
MSTDGGAAFPIYDHSEGIGPVMREPGMSLRDYFAAQVMQAHVTATLINRGDPCETMIPRWAYAMADCMLAEREKGRQTTCPR